jgi:hypothetical protein
VSETGTAAAGRPTTIGKGRIVAWLREHTGHWLFVAHNVRGPYIGCNSCCSNTDPRDWPEKTDVVWAAASEEARRDAPHG